jgi:hypothetical protein
MTRSESKMTIATAIAPAATVVDDDGPLTRTDFLAAGARIWITRFEEITLDYFLTSADPGVREMGEALVAIGQGSFTPTAAERARLREAFGDDDRPGGR